MKHTWIPMLAIILAPFAAAAPPEETASDDLDPASIVALLQQHEELVAQTTRMNARIERLLRAVRERGRETVGLSDIDPLLAGLDSESYRERNEATAALRRSLVDRMWLLIETPDLSREGMHRLQDVLIESSAMIRLTTIAVELTPSDRDALWNLLDDEPAWVLTVLGDDPEAIRKAMLSQPDGQAAAVEIVMAALIRDEMRPIPQILALSTLEDAVTPMLRDALKALLVPRERFVVPGRYTVANSRDQVAELVVRILARRPDPELTGFLLAYLKSVKRWSSRVEYTIVDALVGMRATEAAPILLEIAAEKRERLNGGYGIADMMMKPGDSELIAAARLLDLDLRDLKVKEKIAASADDPNFYGFTAPKREMHPDRKAAYDAIEKAVAEFGAATEIPGYAEAMEKLGEK
jgi:hypothetical protein